MSISLLGRWRKRGGDACAAQYPAEIEFAAARFAGTKDPETQGFIIWDVGGYRVESADVVMIQTASDAQVRYRYRAVGDVMTFTAPDGCNVSYERVATTGGG
jgi:hypothetical protein